MRSDVRIGIAIGLVIILGVVVYFIFSNRTDKTAESVTSSKPAPPAPWRIEIGKAPAGRQVSLVPDKPKEGVIDSMVASGAATGNKAVVPPVDTAKVGVAVVGPAKPDLWATVKTDVKPEPVADPVESQMRKEFDRDGAVGMRGGEPEPVNSRDLGASSGKNSVELALVREADSGVIKTETARRDPLRIDLAKVETAKVEPVKVGPTKSGFEDSSVNIIASEAAKVGENVSDAVRKGEYVVKSGDNGGAWGIAKIAYGDPKLYGLIVKENPTVNWKSLKAGDKIKIPPPPVKAGAVAPAVTNGLGGGSVVADSSKYTVKADDTGAKISKSVYGETKYWSLISKANGDLDARKLKVGAVLTIPPKPAPAGTSGAVGGTGVLGGTGVTGGTAVTGGDTSKYTVKDGDNGEKISKAVYGSTKYWSVIEKANPGLNDRRLKVGQVLTIPPKPAGATGATSRASTGGSADVPMGKAAARRAAAKKLAETSTVPKKAVAKKAVSETTSGETGSAETETVPTGGSAGGNGFD